MQFIECFIRNVSFVAEKVNSSLLLLFSYACRSGSKSPISPITVACAVTYLATASSANQTIHAFEILSFFSIAFFQLKNPFFANAGSALHEVSIPL